MVLINISPSQRLQQCFKFRYRGDSVAANMLRRGAKNTFSLSSGKWWETVSRPPGYAAVKHNSPLFEKGSRNIK